MVADAQGFAQMAAASEAERWDVDLGAMATIWRGGCVIRARFLDRIREAYEADLQTANLLGSPVRSYRWSSGMCSAPSM